MYSTHFKLNGQRKSVASLISQYEGLGSLRSQVVEIVVMVNVRTLSQEFCTRIYAFYMRTNDEAKNFAASVLYFLIGPMLYAAL